MAPILPEHSDLERTKLLVDALAAKPEPPTAPAPPALPPPPPRPPSPEDWMRL